jgi:hypothetical protein
MAHQCVLNLFCIILTFMGEVVLSSKSVIDYELVSCFVGSLHTRMYAWAHCKNSCTCSIVTNSLKTFSHSLIVLVFQRVAMTSFDSTLVLEFRWINVWKTCWAAFQLVRCVITWLRLYIIHWRCSSQTLRLVKVMLSSWTSIRYIHSHKVHGKALIKGNWLLPF